MTNMNTRKGRKVMYDHEKAGEALLKAINGKWQHLADDDGKANMGTACPLCRRGCEECPLSLVSAMEGQATGDCTKLYYKWYRAAFNDSPSAPDKAIIFYLFLSFLYHEYWG